MSNDNTPTLTSDVATVNRDESGDIIPENITVEYRGTTYTTTIKPLTAGHTIKYEEQFGADMDEFDETAIDLIWDNHVVGLDDDWKDTRLPVFFQIIREITNQSQVSDDVREAIAEREQSIEQGN